MAVNHNPQLPSTKGAWPFPKDDQTPKVKEGTKFHLDIAKAIWGYASAFDTHLFYNDREMYRKYREYALGRQSEDQYKPFLNEEKGTSEKDWLKAINFQIKNYATKRINIVISKMHAKDYDVAVEMIDPISKGIIENVKASMAVKMKNKAKLQEMERIFGSDLDTESIPNDKDELDMMIETDFKMIEAMHLEKAIPYHLDRNKYEDQRKNMDFDLTALGVASMYVGMDENLKPYVERWNPADIIAPYNETPDFDLPYIAGIKWVTAAQFRKLAIGYLSTTRIQEIIEEFSRKQYEASDYSGHDIRRFDDVSKIALLLFNYKSTDTMVHVEKPDAMGNLSLHEKPLDYYGTPKELKRFNDKFPDRTLHRTSINAVYEAFWVIGSEDVFRHGRRAYSLENFGVFSNTGMGFKVFAPNAWDGMITSMAAQMIPNLNELQRYNLKVQQLVARAIPKGIGIDIYALRKANLKWGGKAMNDQAKIEMFMKSGLFIFSSKDRYAAGSNYRPFYEVENGLANDIEKYLRLIQNALIELDEIIGMNKAVSASNIREDAGKAVTELQVDAAEVALDHLYKADKRIYNQVVRDLGRLHIQSYAYSAKNRALYDAMFGASGIPQSAIRFDTFDYAFNIQARPTDAEWQDVYRGAERAHEKGFISYSDTLFLREFTSLKQAKMWLMMKEKRAAKSAGEAKQQDVENNKATNEGSIAAKQVADEKTLNRQHSNLMLLEESKRKTLTHQGLIDKDLLETRVKLEAAEDRRGTSQEGKIKDRHLETQGDTAVTVAAVKKANGDESKEKKPAKAEK